MAQRMMGALLSLLGLGIIVLAMQLPEPMAATRIQYGPGFFPTILGIVVLVAGALLAFAGPAPLDPDEEEERSLYGLSDFLKPAIVCLLAIFYIYFSRQLGFLVIAPVIMAILLLLGRVALWKSILIALIGSLIIHLVFHKLLLVPLPLGLLAPWGAYL